MAAKVPIRTVYTNSVATGLAEFQSGEFIDYAVGGTGLAALGSAGQVLKVNSGASALEYGAVEAILNIDGMTDGSGITIVDADKFAISDGGTEKYITASQLSTYITTEIGVNIDGYPDGTGITVAGTDRLLLSDSGTEKMVNVSQIATFVSTSFSTITFEGSTADDYETTLAVTDPTADRTWTIPNSTDTFVGRATTDTLTNKSIDLGTNTLTGSVAEFNSALQSESFATLTGTETLTNKTLASPTFTTQFTIGSATISEAELEILDGASVSTSELNILDGVTASAAQLNYSNISTLGTSQASKVVTVDSSGDLIVPDSDKYKFGAGSDMQLYHDGTNSYITNATGALKIATETSGIALTIGHSTSQVTIADNLTVVGNLTVTGTETIQDTVTMQAQNAVVFEGATADDYETTLTIVDPTADRTVYMPNATGYLPLLAAASTTTITATPAELNYSDGVTSAIQTQMDTKATKAFSIAQAVALG